MLADRRHFAGLHFRWAVAFIFSSLAIFGWYAWVAVRAERLPGGGSPTGLVFGTLAGAIFVFECALALRKSRWFRTMRWLGNAQLWMKAHLWLGLFTVPLVALHCGFRCGGLFTSMFLGLFGVVIASGIGGWILQNILPRLMTEWVERETIYSQISQVSRQFESEGWNIVTATCGDEEMVSSLDRSAGHEHYRSGREIRVYTEGGNDSMHVIGSRRHVGLQVERSPNGSLRFPLVRASGALRVAFQQDLADFLRTGKSHVRALMDRRLQRDYFIGLRRMLPLEAHAAASHLEELCRYRLDFNLQRKLHFMLHGWLVVHMPVSLVLLVFLAIHIFSALRFG